MRRHKPSYNSTTKESYSFQVKESKDVLTEQPEEEPIEEPGVEYIPQSSLKNDTDENEEPEEDPEEEPEEDPEEDPEEYPEEESSVEPDNESAEELSKCVSPVLCYWNNDETKQPVEDPNEDASKEFASKLSSKDDTDRTDHQSECNQNHSKEKKRSLDATASDSDALQVYQSQKKFRQEEAFKTESDGGSAVTDLHGRSVVSEVILNDESGSKPQEHTGSSGKRRRSRWDQQPEQDGETGDRNKSSKRRKTRWASDVSQLKMLGPIQLPDFMKDLAEWELGPEIQELKLRLLEINSKLLSSEVHGDRPEQDRSPSSQPEYSTLGIGVNTRQVRLRKRFEKERQSIIAKLVKMNPTFKTPDNKPPKYFKKLYIPVKEYPEYNFVGLIIGPRGNTQKRMEKKTGAKILLRGKGSMKTQQKKPDASDDDDLHVLLEADNQKSLDAAVTMVEKLLIPIDEGMNEHKRTQLEELAKLNGTYRNGNICSVCKEQGHKNYACPHRQSTFKTVITCAMCGSFCHTTSSCPLIASPQVGNTLCGSSGLGGSSIPCTKGKPNKETSDADLYVGYLPQAVDENWLRELFCPFGKITEVKVIKDRNTGISKGYGFVKFESPVDAAMAVMHMNGHKMEGKMLAVRVAGRPPAATSSVLSLLPMYPGPAAISADVPRNQTAWPGPPGSALPEAQASFLKSKGSCLPSSSVSLGYGNHLPKSEVIDLIPSVVSNHERSRLASSFDSFHGYPNQTPFSSPGLLSQFPGDPDYPGSQFLSYFATPTLKPSPSFYQSDT